MSGPIAPPPSIVTANGSRIIIAGTPAAGDTLTADGPNTAHWGNQVALGGTPKSPLDIGQPLLYWLLANGSGTEGAEVNGWTDSSGLGIGFIASQLGTYANHGATFHAATGPKATPALDFAISGGYQHNAGVLPLSDNFTFFGVIRHPAGQSVKQYVIGSDYGNGAPIVSIIDGKMVFEKANAAILSTSAVAIPSAAWSLVLMRFTGADSVCKWDIDGNVNQSAPGAPVSFPSAGASIGQNTSSDRFLGSLAEFGMFRTALTDGDLASLKAYLYGKYFR